jgi:hypothetical protein
MRPDSTTALSRCAFVISIINLKWQELGLEQVARVMSDEAAYSIPLLGAKVQQILSFATKF